MWRRGDLPRPPLPREVPITSLGSSCTPVYPVVYAFCRHLNRSFPRNRAKTKPPRKGACEINGNTLLAVARHCPHLTRQEVVRRPRTGHHHLAVLQLLGGRAVPVLVFFDGFGIDQVGDIEQHSVGIHLLTADFLFQRIEEFVYLDRKRARLGLAFPLPRSLFTQLQQVFAPHRIRQDDLFHIPFGRSVAYRQLDAHLRLAPEPRHTLAERAPVRAYGLADGIFGVENGSKTERKHGCSSKTLADHASMFQNRFFIEFGARTVIFADNYREFPARITHNGG